MRRRLCRRFGKGGDEKKKAKLLLVAFQKRRLFIVFDARQIARLRKLAEEAGLDPVFSEKFLRFIVAEVIHHHERIAGGSGAPGIDG